MKRGIRHFPRLWRASRLARRWYNAHAGAYPDWRALIASESDLWQSARAGAQGGPRVLMATSIGSYAHAATLESVLSAALTFRGAEVHVLLCDGSMTACAECDASLYPNLAHFAEHGPSGDLCRNCFSPAERVYSQLGIKVHRYSEWLTAEDRAEASRIATTIPAGDIQSYTLDGLVIGEHAHAGAIRFFATGSLEDEPMGESDCPALPRVGASRGICRTPTVALGTVFVGRFHRTASMCPGGSSARWPARKGYTSPRGTWPTESGGSSSATTILTITR